MWTRAIAIVFGLTVSMSVAMDQPTWADAHEKEKAGGVTAETKLKLAKRVLEAVATVEITLEYDKGESPGMGGSNWGGSGGYYGRGYYAQQFIAQERPMELPGLALSNDVLLVSDVLIHERFIENIMVRVGDRRVNAKIIAWMRHQPAMLVKLDQPLAGLTPLTFDADADGPFLTATLGGGEDGWRVDVGLLGESVSVFTDGRERIELAKPSLVLTADGVGVGASFYDHLPVDDSWKGTPLSWSQLKRDGEDGRDAVLKQLDAMTASSLPRVTLNFRSPSKSGDDFGSMMRRRMGGFGDDEEAATELHGPGIRIDERRVVVLATIDAGTTARLERIRVFDADGKGHEAKFVASLRDHGALIVELNEAMAGGVKLDEGDIRAYRHELMPTVELRIAGPQRIAYFGHDRLEGFELGWKRQLYPETAGDSESSFVFDESGKLVAFPMVRRSKPSMEDQYSDDDPVLTPAAHLSRMLSNLSENTDPNNVPLSEEEENRLAWMGVVLQPLDQDLARLNEVSDVTNDGQTGGLVTFVYPDSPAAQAGIEPGQILLRLHVEGFPNPINIQLNDRFQGFAFPWEQLDQIPEEYFDQLPTPWPSASNALNETLTSIGFGKRYEAEFIVNGEPVRQAFTVDQSPRHYSSAAKFKSEGLGLTVKNVTYEVAQYLRLREDDPGIIVSKIEPGSRASVAGIKPYELITHVDGEPVSDVEQFEALVAAGGELRLSVKRMTRSRQVVIRGTE